MSDIRYQCQTVSWTPRHQPDGAEISCIRSVCTPSKQPVRVIDGLG